MNSMSAFFKHKGGSSLYTIFSVLLVLGFVFLSATAEAQGASASSAPLLLPLKIRTPGADSSLREITDGYFTEAASVGKIEFMARKKAQELFNYDDSWPPSRSTIEKLLADREGLTLAGAGSITRIGDMFSIDIAVYNLANPKVPVKYLYRQTRSRDEITASLSELVAQISGLANRTSLIAEVKIEGNKLIDTGAILRQINVSAGEPYNPSAIRRDIKNIFKMGYFKDVRVDAEPTPQGSIITYKVEEKKIINAINITGNDKIKEEDIREVVTLKPSSIINNREIQTSIENILGLYREKGYFNATVDTKLTEALRDRVDLNFLITEGEKIFIKEINIVGNETFDDDDILDVISSAEKGFFSWITDSGLLNRDILDHDSSRITAFYHNNGFIEAKVSEPEITQRDEWFYVTFHVEEGERYKTGKIDVSGDIIVDKQKIIKLVRVDDEEYFSRQVLREDVLRITDLYSEKGYAFAEINPQSYKNPESRTVDITFDINKGNLIHINRIIIKGNTGTRDNVIRRELEKVDEKGIFNAKELKTGKEKLQRLDYFEEIGIRPEPTIDETLLDIIIDVKEKPTGSFNIGAGYSSVEQLSFMGEISENNFLGRGQRLSASANLSSTTTHYNINFTDPRIFDSHLLLGGSLYDWEREYDDYTKESTGASARFGYPVWNEWKLIFGYSYDDTTLSDINELTASPSIIESSRYHITSSAKIGFLKDTRNRIYDATKGSRHSLEVEYAGGPLGGDNGFTRLEGSTSWYFPLFWGMTFHSKLAGGAVDENSDEHLPVYEKFYLGGLTTIRGFDSGEISPVEIVEYNFIQENAPATGPGTGAANFYENRVGGLAMWYSNIEVIFPLVKDAGLKGVVFYDIGRVSGTSTKNSAGVGFRWLSPVGPLRLEWGYNLDPEEGEDQSNWDFSIGAAF